MWYLPLVILGCSVSGREVQMISKPKSETVVVKGKQGNATKQAVQRFQTDHVRVDNFFRSVFSVLPCYVTPDEELKQAVQRLQPR